LKILIPGCVLSAQSEILTRAFRAYFINYLLGHNLLVGLGLSARPKCVQPRSDFAALGEEAACSCGAALLHCRRFEKTKTPHDEAVDKDGAKRMESC